MPDITMCDGKGCTLKDDCYRYRAKPGLWQSFFMVAPFIEYEGRQVCTRQWPMEEEEA